MNCRQVQKYLDDLLSAGPGHAVEPNVTEHMAHCARCQREHEAAITTLALLQPSAETETSTNLKERVMKAIEAVEYAESHKPERTWFGAKVWKPIFVVGVAAVFAILVAPLILFKPSDRVYAIEQTIEANRSLRSIHMRMTPERFGSVGEIWAQFDENGELEKLRMNFPDTEDGPKDVVWENGKAAVWFKAKGSVLVVKEAQLLERMRMGYRDFDPKLLVESLYEKQASNAADVEVEEPQTAGGPITLKVTAEGAPDRQDVCTVDPKTKLLQRLDVYRLRDGNYELDNSFEYLEYNEPIDPETFVLNASGDATLVDQTVQEIGIAQGNLSDNEIAVKVVREFFEALIAKDYAKAGQLYEGMPASKVEESFSRLNIVRIVSIGEPTPYALNQSLRVPCKVEVESDGKTSIMEPHGPFVRQVYQQPGRWDICGGI